jgi:hypothetical protein
MNFPGEPGKGSHMYIFKLIGLTIFNLFREAWRLTKATTGGAKDRRQQARQEVSEAERLDRIRQPWKYAGR